MRTLAVTAFAALALAPAAVPAVRPVLGVDVNGPRSRLAWFDPQTLRMLPGRKAPLAWHVGSWSLSPDRATLAIGGEGTVLRFVDARRMRVLGDLRLAAGGDSIGGVTWLPGGRLLAFVRRVGDTELVAVDPARRRVLGRESLEGSVDAIGRLPDALVLLLRPADGIGAARVAVVGATGGVRSAELPFVRVGSPLQLEAGEVAHVAAAGFAVDPVGRRAWVLGADAAGEVDLDTLAVDRRSSPRELAKALEGSFRTARWLGGGLVALAGADYVAAGQEPVPFGLRVLDVRGWTSRTIDAAATGFDVAAGLLLVRRPGQAAVYTTSGAAKAPIPLAADEWLNVSAGSLATVCANREARRVVDPGVGTTRPAAGAVCADLLGGSSSDY